MMPVQLKVVTSAKDLKSFIRFPHSLYRGNPYYVPLLTLDEFNTLSPQKNPAFEYCEARYWLAYRDGEIVGRVGAILNRKHIEKWNQPYLRFGWLDFIDDHEVSAALMGAVEGWARECSLTAVHGPLGFTDMDREGMLIEGFDELGTMATNYNHPYYPQHLEGLGYLKDTDWVEYELSVPETPNEKIARAAELVLKRYNLRLLPARSKRDLLPYADELFALLEDAYSHLYGTVPMTDKQVKAYTKMYFDFIQPDFVPVVLDEKGKMIAFGISMPSLSKALQKAKGEMFPLGWFHLLRAFGKNDRADLYLVAVADAWQGKGVNAILMNYISETFVRRGIRKVESNPELETNANVQSQWKFYDVRQHKRRRCFIKHI